jgi:RNA polymerase sigma-70 factor, ECF subfamily
MNSRAVTDDEELLAAAARGDASTFVELVRRHTTRMHRVAMRILGDAAEAEDVVQEAWISAWRSLAGFRGDSAPSTWLFRVVTNAALMHLRRRRPTVPLDAQHHDGTCAPESRAARRGEVADASDGPEASALRTEQVDTVLRAISALEPAQRVPLVMRELEGRSYEEMAELLGVGVPALRSRVYRARSMLLARLRELR